MFIPFEARPRSCFIRLNTVQCYRKSYSEITDYSIGMFSRPFYEKLQRFVNVPNLENSRSCYSQYPIAIRASGGTAMCMQEINKEKVIKFPVLIFTLSKDSRACSGKAETENAKEMLWNGSLKESWAFSLMSTRCIPNNKRPIAQEISLDNKPQTETESMTEIKC